MQSMAHLVLLLWLLLMDAAVLLVLLIKTEDGRVEALNAGLSASLAAIGVDLGVGAGLSILICTCPLLVEHLHVLRTMRRRARLR